MFKSQYVLTNVVERLRQERMMREQKGGGGGIVYQEAVVGITTGVMAVAGVAHVSTPAGSVVFVARATEVQVMMRAIIRGENKVFFNQMPGLGCSM